MHKVSVLGMKVIRKIRNKFSNWYNTTSFLSGIEEYTGKYIIPEGVSLWCNHVTLGEKAHIYKGVTLWGPGRIKIGANTEIGINCTIYSTQYVEIGNDTSLAANCYVIDSNHGIKKDELIRNQKSIVKGPVIIGDDVWLGAGVKVLSGVHIGNGAVIGAGAVVNGDVPDNAIAVGVPAQVIAYRN